MRNRLLLSCSAFALLSLGGCEFFDNYVQDCPPGTVIGHCEWADHDERPDFEPPERPDPPADDDGGCKDPKSY